MEKTDALYQYYATVHYLTCEQCLRRHGEIFHSLDLAPPLHEGCRCSYLKFKPTELNYYKEKSTRMKAKAEQELKRRGLFWQAAKLLRSEPKKALELFQAAAAIEVYLPEIEKLCQRNLHSVLRSNLPDDPDLAKELQRIFINGYQDKFIKDKYQHMPEGMRWARESWGVKWIKELFGDALALR